VISIAAGVVRAKVLALLLGPFGIGLMGVYNSIMNTVSTISGMGIHTSGVRQIADSLGIGDEKQIACARFTLIWITRLLAVLGAIGLFVLRRNLSIWYFEEAGHEWSIAILALGVFFTVIAGSQKAVMTGFRRIGDIARSTIIGSVAGTVLAILIVWHLGQSGIAPLIVSVAFVSVLISWWYVRKIPKTSYITSIKEVYYETKSVLGLGLVFMSTAFMQVGTAFIIRFVITRKLGLDFTGYFQASWSISALYTNLVLMAMGTDYYPRLTSIHQDRAASNRLVNEQTEVAFLLSGPVILAMLSFTPIVVWLLYSGSFGATHIILRWQVLGTLFKVASWPMGFILMARGFGKTFFVTELFWNASFLIIVCLGIDRYNIEITGIAFLVSYLAYFFLIYLIVSKINHFAWTKFNKIFAVTLAGSCTVIFLSSFYADWLSYVVGGATTLIFSVYVIRFLHRIVEDVAVRVIIDKMKSLFGF